ncbi:hypothetical protein [Endozoicomonas sp. YOMI1]|uniref:hypothetical protein n=1 Tax=Endozoicomonas sp. YOMI1 TaxID=2828739 RepID=UPI002147B771|nr:hypothetical protein [Endozoicomonas sp. YOMI1]
MKAPLHYRKQMEKRYPNNWPMEAFTFWVDYYWKNGNEPTYEQWKKHQARQQAYNKHKANRVQASRKVGLETLKLLYGKLEADQ